jgi:hypothetical protein
MKIQASGGGGKFDPCPAYKGSAVCVDVTPPETVNGKFGPQEKFRIVFEVGIKQENGSPFCVWSMPMTATWGEKSNLRKFLKDWFGRLMTDAELKDFDTEQLIGRPAYVVIAQEVDDKDPDKIYANIKFIEPDTATDPLKPSGKFIRKKDRVDKKGGSGQDSTYRKTGDAQGAALDDWQKLKVHVGSCTGIPLCELTETQVMKLSENWLPKVRAQEKQTADDKRLITALEQWHKAKAAKEQKASDDQVPMNF